MIKKSIYLFCNKGYGRAFFNQFLIFAKTNPEVSCYAFLSTKGYKKGILSRLKRYLVEFVRAPQDLWRFRAIWSRVRFYEIRDVNKLGFIKKIPKGSHCFVAGFNQIFHKDFINQFDVIINFHPSILPFYKGAIPSYWVIKNHEKITGFSAHIVTEKIDEGEIIFQETIKVRPGISESELDEDISKIASEYFFACLEDVNSQRPLRRKQVESPYIKPLIFVPSKRV